jgi:uncharacterized membrane protein (DUF485 family)
MKKYIEPEMKYKIKSKFIMVNNPETKTLNTIQKENREKIKVNAPISKMVAFGCLGYIIAEITTIAKLFEKSIFDKSDIISLIILSIAFAGFVITGIYSFRGKSEIEKILENIRSRPFVTVTKEE